MEHPLNVLHVDGSLVVLDKPAGLLSVPGQQGPDCLSARVQARYPDALIVHRLDQATSGLLVMARGTTAQSRLSRAFADRRVHKRYIALVTGHPPEPDSEDGWGEINLPLNRDWPNRPRQKVDFEEGKPSRTLWRVLGREGAYSRLELEPVTGRSHQLRVHLLALGYPILGDDLYAPDPSAPRMMLHATALSLPHPRSGQTLAFASPAPF
jgi:tRNA pseudouridine32 synthase/23S rRNA pseudouridine746 synthase